MSSSLHIEIKNLFVGRSNRNTDENQRIEVIEKAIQGDPAAQKLLFMDLAPKMKLVCRRYAADEAQMQDFVQEGFIRFFDKLYTFKGGAKLETWASRLFVNNCLTMLRKEKRRREKREDYAEDLQHEEMQITLTNEEEQCISPEMILDCIQQLPTGYRTVLNLFIYEDKGHKEIADMLGISINTSKTQYFKAKKMLKKLLEEACQL